jgi:hypothetical protein
MSDALTRCVKLMLDSHNGKVVGNTSEA